MNALEAASTCMPLIYACIENDTVDMSAFQTLSLAQKQLPQWEWRRRSIISSAQPVMRLFPCGSLQATAEVASDWVHTVRLGIGKALLFDFYS